MSGSLRYLFGVSIFTHKKQKQNYKKQKQNYNKIIISITQKGQLTKHVAQQWGSKNVDSLASMGPEINIYVQTKLFAIQCSGQFDYYND